MLSGDVPPEDPAHPSPEPVKATLSIWNSLLIGVIAGFGTSLGSFLFAYIRHKRKF